MRLGSVATLLLLSCLLSLPLAAAQAPPLPPAPPIPEPDPAEAVALACGTIGGPAPDVRDMVPVCPRVEPAASAAPEEAHVHDPAQVPGTPQDVPGLAADVAEDVQGIPEDPAGAPERVAAVLATILQFLRDLLSLPAKGIDVMGTGIERVIDAVETALDSTGDAIVGAAEAVAEGTANARDAVAAGLAAAKAGAEDLAQKVRNFLDPFAPETPVEAPKPGDVARDAREGVAGLRELARGEVGQVLPEGQ